jgi:hypothetical protein
MSPEVTGSDHCPVWLEIEDERGRFLNEQTHLEGARSLARALASGA